MWHKFSELKECDRNLSGCLYVCENNKIPQKAHPFDKNKYILKKPIYIAKIDDEISYSLEQINQDEYIYENKEYVYPDEIFMSNAGELNLHDEGEFGGYLELNEKILLNGNFRHIFEFQGRKFVIDSLHHMTCKTFRLVEYFDDGHIEVIYDADKLSALHDEFYSNYANQTKQQKETYYHSQKGKYKLNILYEVGFSVLKVTPTALYFFCNGTIFDVDKQNDDRYKNVSYILVYDGKTFKEHNMFFDDCFSDINSFEFSEEDIFIGMDKQVVKYNKATNTYKIYTNLSDNEIDNLEKGF